MSSPPRSPDPAPSPPPETAASTLEYIPSTSPPPPLPTSESMRRIRELFTAKKLTLQSQLSFTYNGRNFVATLTEEGTLCSPAPRPNAARLSPTVSKVYSSPTEFASEMARLALSSDPKLPKPRGRVAVNGWDECLVDGRSLASLRSEMLREKKPLGAPSNPSSRQSKRIDIPEVAVQSEPEHAVTGDAKPVDNDRIMPDTTKANRELAEAPEKPGDQSGERDLGSKDSKISQEESKTEQPSPKAALKDNPPPPAPPEVAESSKLESIPTIDAAPAPSERIHAESTAKHEDVSPQSQPHLEGKEKVRDEVEPQAFSAQMTPDGRPTEDDTVVQSSKTDPPHQSEAKTQSKKEFSSEARKLENEAELSSKIKTDSESHSVPPDSNKTKPEASAEVDSKDADAELPRRELYIDKKNHVAEEKRKSPSPSKSESRKRKRSESNESSPSDRNTPSRQIQERATHRTEWNKDERKLEIPSVSEMNTEGLDAETIEAVAIAAQAEKDEANSRGRRTTRLAAGKIKQVDYKAAGSVQGTRAYSPSNEEDDAENIQSNDSNVEPARTSRRRPSQNQVMAPQRSSRRVARMRSSQEKDQSSMEEQDLSSPGNGSESRGEADAGASQNDINVEPASGPRMNGSKADGRDRKRSKSDGRKTRQQQAGVTDFEGNERTNYGTRSSTRENSVVDMEEDIDDAASSDDVNVAESEKMEEDLEKRTDRHGWTIQQLTRIGNVIEATRSIYGDSINDELYWTGKWSSDDGTNKKVASYIGNTVACITNLKKELSQDQKEKEVTAGELCSFVAMDVWRMKTSGLRTEYPYKPTSILARAEKEEKQKVSLERIRRKLQREADDCRNKLDGELEIRRKLELEAAYLELQALEIAYSIPVEEARRHRLGKVIKQYGALEGRVQRELDKTKILMSQLRGERESQDELPTIQKNSNVPHSPTPKTDDLEDDDVLKEATQPLGESATYDEDVKMTHKEEASPSQRQQEMERLRDLIAAREAEAESLQRACEKERMKFSNIFDAKNRLEVELYMSKSHGVHGHGGSVAGPLPSPSNSVAEKSKKDASRKIDARNNGVGVTRIVGQAKGKPNNGKQSLGVSPAISKPKPSALNNLKAIPGKNGETSKGMKKKSNGKPTNPPSGQ